MKRYHNEETTLDVSHNGFVVRVWIVNPYQKNVYTTEELSSLISGTHIGKSSIPVTDFMLAEAYVAAVVDRYPDIAAVQVIRPDKVGHMVYTTEYNGDPV